MLIGCLMLAGLSYQTLAQPSPMSLHYPLDQARRWLMPSEISRQWNQLEFFEGRGEPIVKTKKLAFDEIDVAPSNSGHRTEMPNSWEIPPFADIEPPLPDNLPRPKGAPAEDVPVAFSSIPTRATRPSAHLRPKRGLSSETVRSNDLRIPPSFSSTRYDFDTGLVQISLYGGTNSFDAEQAYFALRNSLKDRENLEGFGKQACHGIYQDEIESSNEPAAPVSKLTFGDIAPVGKRQPEALNPNAQNGRKAPSFQDIPTPGSSGTTRVQLPSSQTRPKKIIPPKYEVFISYYPQKAVTVELALDTRTGSLTELIALALRLNLSILGQPGYN